MCLSVPRQVAAGGVMLATLGAGVLRLHFLKQHWGGSGEIRTKLKEKLNSSFHEATSKD